MPLTLATETGVWILYVFVLFSFLTSFNKVPYSNSTVREFRVSINANFVFSRIFITERSSIYIIAPKDRSPTLISSPLDIKEWSATVSSKTKIVLFPNAEARLSDIEIQDSVSIAIGPEGDFTEKEISYLKESGFLPVTIGKRILRAETAAISVISALRYGAKEF